MKIKEFNKMLNEGIKPSFYLLEDIAWDEIKNISETFELSEEEAEEVFLSVLEEDKEIFEAGVLGNVVGLLVFDPILWAAWRALGGMFSKAKRKCGTFTISNARDVCILNAKIKFAEEKIKIISKAAEKSKDPQKAKKKAEEKIKDIKEDIRNWEEKIGYLKAARGLK